MAPRKTRNATTKTTEHQAAAVPTGADQMIQIQEQSQLWKIKYETIEKENQRLKVEIQTLRVEIESLKNGGRNLKASKDLNSQRTRSLSTPQQSVRTVGKGCTCKGNCANKICGCVKRKVQCTESCKCNESTCQNQEPDKENIVNVNEEGTSKEVQESFSRLSTTDNHQDVLKNVANSTPRNNLEKTKRAKGIFSPSSPDSVFDGEELTDMTVEFPMLTNGFDPMKPRHQLIRSPPNRTNTTQYSGVSLPSPEPEKEKTPSPPHQPIRSLTNSNNTTQYSEVLQPIPKLEKEKTPPPPKGIEQPEINWDEHQKQLLPCKRCKRKFFPHRLKKHEANCKKI